MANARKVQIELVKLANGARLLRFTDAKLGVSVERKLDGNRPVDQQKRQLAEVFEAAIARAELAFT